MFEEGEKRRQQAQTAVQNSRPARKGLRENTPSAYGSCNGSSTRPASLTTLPRLCSKGFWRRGRTAANQPREAVQTLPPATAGWGGFLKHAHSNWNSLSSPPGTHKHLDLPRIPYFSFLSK